MNYLALIADLDRPLVDAAPVRRMLGVSRSCHADGEDLVEAPHVTCGAGRLVTTPEDRLGPPVCHDHGRGLVIAVDARLDERAALGAELFGPGAAEVSDAELVAAGYRRWGEALPDRLRGDFAFVIVDLERRTVIAARDPFGVRTLYYCRTAGAIRFASSVAASRAADDGPRAVNADVVLQYLMGHVRSASKTLFEGIEPVRAGHLLQFDGRTVHHRRHFWVPARSAEPGEGHEERFREALRLAVRRRLRSSHTALLHLSGGLDSSSIVCLADDLQRRGEAPCAGLVAASAVYPGLACDESALIATVTRRLSFPWESWDDSKPWLVAWEHPSLEMLGLPGARAMAQRGEPHIAARHGARAVLSGAAGDEVCMTEGLSDLAAHREWRRLGAEILHYPLADGGRKLRLAADAVLGLVPPRLRRMGGRLVRRAPSPPAWLGPALRRQWPGQPADPAVEVPGHLSAAQRRVWAVLTAPTLLRGVELRQRSLAQVGLEGRYPFLDRDLVELALALPWRLRLPSGLKRRFQREAMRGVIPEEIRGRAGQTTFESTVVSRFRAARPSFATMLEGKRWEAASFVDQRAARTMLQGLPEEPTWQDASAVSRIVALESCLRAVNA